MWVVLWAVVVLFDPVVGGLLVEQENPTFKSEEDCKTYVERHTAETKPRLAVFIGVQEAQIKDLQGVCRVKGQQI